MRRARIVLMLIVALTAIAANLPAFARGGHHHHRHHHHGSVSFGFAFGGPWYWPGYYPYYPAYYPRVVSYPAEPTYYIERGDAGAAEQSSQGYWYYCRESKTYHPYVKHCPGGWEKQIPAAPPNR